MKSNKQRRNEILLRRQRIRQQKEAAIVKEKPLIKGQWAVNVANLAPNNSYGIPSFVTRGFYEDRPFFCKACGAAQIWTAAQQQWWYETVKGDVWAIAVLCRPCRKKEQERKAIARKVHLEGLRKKQNDAQG